VSPAAVTTQPASELSVTGAVLNGSITVGPDETLAWFEWGTNTNYGDIAGIASVPANSGSNPIRAKLNGLSGNIYYHYRLDAANGFGTVYGEDQFFRADSPPTYLFEIDAYIPHGYALIDPNGIAVDSSGNVYVIDNDNHVTKFGSRGGSFMTQWGGSGKGNGQFNQPGGIAVDSSDNVFVTDVSNNRIQKFDSNGNFLAQWGGFGKGNGQFSGPQGIAVDSSDDVFVTDYGNGRVEKFDANGNYLTQWGVFSYSPGGVAVDSTGNFIYVITTYGGGGPQVQAFVNNSNIVSPLLPASLRAKPCPRGPV